MTTLASSPSDVLALLRPLARRSFLGFSGLALLGALPGLSACSGASLQVTVPQIVAGIEDAQIILGQIASFVAAYFQANPNPALSAKIQAVMNDAEAALDAVVKIGSTVSDVADKNLQQAIADFSAAFAAVLALVQQIGVQVGSLPSGAKAKLTPATANAPATLTITEPILVRASKAVAPNLPKAPAAAPAK